MKLYEALNNVTEVRNATTKREVLFFSHLKLQENKRNRRIPSDSNIVIVRYGCFI